MGLDIRLLLPVLPLCLLGSWRGCRLVSVRLLLPRLPECLLGTERWRRLLWIRLRLQRTRLSLSLLGT